MALALFAFDRRHWLNDKTAMDEIGELSARPARFRERVEGVLAAPGHGPEALRASVGAIVELFEETATIAGELYRAKFDLGA